MGVINSIWSGNDLLKAICYIKMSVSSILLLNMKGGMAGLPAQFCFSTCR